MTNTTREVCSKHALSCKCDGCRCLKINGFSNSEALEALRESLKQQCRIVTAERPRRGEGDESDGSLGE